MDKTYTTPEFDIALATISAWFPVAVDSTLDKLKKLESIEEFNKATFSFAVQSPSDPSLTNYVATVKLYNGGSIVVFTLTDQPNARIFPNWYFNNDVSFSIETACRKLKSTALSMINDTNIYLDRGSSTEIATYGTSTMVFFLVELNRKLSKLLQDYSNG